MGRKIERKRRKESYELEVNEREWRRELKSEKEMEKGKDREEKRRKNVERRS